jgi:hypothetical protein
VQSIKRKETKRKEIQPFKLRLPFVQAFAVVCDDEMRTIFGAFMQNMSYKGYYLQFSSQPGLVGEYAVDASVILRKGI